MASIATKAVTTKPIITKCISSQKVGVVVSAGKMARAVKVRVAGQEWNKEFRKHFPAPRIYIASDPNNSVVEGDIVRITSGYRTSKVIRHIVTAIVAPFGKPVEDRPPVLPQAQLDEERIKQRLLKDVRAAERGRQASIQRLAQARKQGLRIPTLQEAMQAMRIHEEAEKARAEAHGGQVGQQKSAAARRVEQGNKTKEEVKAQRKVKEARDQIA